MKVRATLIMPESDAEMIRAKHWLVARNKTFKMIYIPITINSKAPVIMTEFSFTDRLLYKLTFGHRSERLTAFT